MGLRLSTVTTKIRNRNASEAQAENEKKINSARGTSLCDRTRALCGALLESIIGTAEDRSRRRATAEEQGLAKFDADQDGLLSAEEIAELGRRLIKVQNTRDMLKRALKLTLTIAFVSCLVLSAVMVSCSFFFQSTTVSDLDQLNSAVVLTRFSPAGSSDVVATASAESVLEFAASKGAFDKLHALSIFQSRPRLILVEFNDATSIQFPPENIQIFSHSITLANTAVGVALVIAQDKFPKVRFVGGVDGLEFVEPQVPAGPYDALQMAEKPAPRVGKIRLYQPRATNITTPFLDSDGTEGEGEAPVSTAEIQKNTQKAFTVRLKLKLIPLIMQTRDLRTSSLGRLLHPNAQHWELVFESPVDLYLVRQLCEALDELTGA